MLLTTNLLRYDPSRTTLLRRQYVAEMTRRFAAFQKAVYTYVASDTELGLAKVSGYRPTTNAPRFQFLTKPQKLKRFQKWLQDEINKLILEINPVTGEPKGMKPWMYKYVSSAYKKGMIRSYMQTHPELAQRSDVFAGSKQGFLESSFNRPERVSKLQLLYTRSYEDLKGVTSHMSTKIGRVLADGMVKGDGPVKIARRMSNEIKGITKKRAVLIAQTETIHAQAEGQLDGLQDLGHKKVKAEVEFLTSQDDAVCPECAAMEGETYTIAEARGVIPVHPRCRCAWIPVA